MNKLKIFGFLFLGSLAMNAQDLNQNQVPNEVSSAFENEYPSAKDVEWEKEGVAFQVEFEQGGMDRELWYDASGKISKAEKELKSNDLPSAVRKTLKNDYADFKIEDVEMRSENNDARYHVELENNGAEKELALDESGKVLSKSAD